MFCTYCCILCTKNWNPWMKDIQSLRKLILNYSNFTYTHTCELGRSYQISIPVAAGLIGLFYLRLPSSRVLGSSIAWLWEDGKQRSRSIDDRGAASVISRRIFLPLPLNARFNLHLYCINSKKRLHDKEEEGIDAGRSTIKAIKIVNGRSDTGRISLSPRASNFLNYTAENAREKLTETSTFSFP